MEAALPIGMDVDIADAAKHAPVSRPDSNGSGDQGRRIHGGNRNAEKVQDILTNALPRFQREPHGIADAASAIILRRRLQPDWCIAAVDEVQNGTIQQRASGCEMACHHQGLRDDLLECAAAKQPAAEGGFEPQPGCESGIGDHLHVAVERSSADVVRRQHFAERFGNTDDTAPGGRD